MNNKIGWGFLISVVAISGVLVFARLASAGRYTSPNYTIDASVGNSFGGNSGSNSYKLTSSGGESIVGNGEGGSYKLTQGYVAQLEQAIQISVQSSIVDFGGEVIPGSSRQGTSTIEALTDAPGYTIGLAQNNDLTSGANTIPAISSGTINSPVSWNEGTTKGLGFSLLSTNATAIPAKWNSGSAYARLPTTTTTTYVRSGYTGGGIDTLTLRYRLDVDSTQPTGAYTSTVTYTGVITP